MRLRRNVAVCVATLLGAFAPPANAGDNVSPYVKRPLAAIKAASPPTIDGDLSDAAWKTAAKAETFTDRQNGTVVADQTVAWLTYDKAYLYVAFLCKESQPDQITARETMQDS